MGTKKSRRIPILLGISVVVILSFVLVSCGDDDENTEDTQNSPHDTGTLDDTGEDTGSGEEDTDSGTGPVDTDSGPCVPPASWDIGPHGSSMFNWGVTGWADTNNDDIIDEEEKVDMLIKLKETINCTGKKAVVVVVGGNT